jgi:hypothetical protein
MAAIDDEARAHGLTRSAFIASAALEKINRRNITRGIRAPPITHRREMKMKKLLLTAAICIAIAPTSADAQQFIGGGSGNTYGHYRYVNPAFGTLTPKDLSCYRANYASTLAMQRCADAAIAGMTARSRKARR